MDYFVYILKSKIKLGWFYVGSTSYIVQRLKDHNAGKTKSTKPFRPFEIIYTEKYRTKADAYERELFLKSGLGREEKREILKNSGIV